MKVLIVDDADVIRARLVAMIQEIGKNDVALPACNAESAYAIFQESHPDVVILDIQLPGENGIRILENLRKRSPDVPIIMLTNFPYPQYREKCQKLGANHFLNKSNEFESVQDLIEQIRQS